MRLSEAITLVSIPSHLGSSFGRGIGADLSVGAVSQYPLIWAVASDEWISVNSEIDLRSQYPLIWAVASDSVEEITQLPYSGLNTLSFGQ